MNLFCYHQNPKAPNFRSRTKKREEDEKIFWFQIGFLQTGSIIYYNYEKNEKFKGNRKPRCNMKSIYTNVFMYVCMGKLTSQVGNMWFAIDFNSVVCSRNSYFHWVNINSIWLIAIWFVTKFWNFWSARLPWDILFFFLDFLNYWLCLLDSIPQQK